MHKRAVRRYIGSSCWIRNSEWACFDNACITNGRRYIMWFLSAYEDPLIEHMDVHGDNCISLAVIEGTFHSLQFLEGNGANTHNVNARG